MSRSRYVISPNIPAVCCSQVTLRHSWSFEALVSEQSWDFDIFLQHVAADSSNGRPGWMGGFKKAGVVCPEINSISCTKFWNFGGVSDQSMIGLRLRTMWRRFLAVAGLWWIFTSLHVPHWWLENGLLCGAKRLGRSVCTKRSSTYHAVAYLVCV